MSVLPDEFAWIASLRPLSRGDPRALNLADDAAAIPARSGFDLVISTDAMVAGVHFPPDEFADVVARRLLRAALSDLAAKAAEPFGYLLVTAWPETLDGDWRNNFRAGLAADGDTFSIALLGGDTVSTPGPLTLCATVLGWAPEHAMVRRSTARADDQVVVCGPIGDGWLGLRAVQGEISDPEGHLAQHYRLPVPLLALRDALLADARAAADVSDGLLADVAHIAEASGTGVIIDLTEPPLSAAARDWLAAQADPVAARLDLATGGDDYAIVCAIPPERAQAFMASVRAAGVPVAIAGRFQRKLGLDVRYEGRTVIARRTGWRHL